MRSAGPDTGGSPVDDVVARLRAPGGYEAFAERVRQAGCCRRPVRLSGRVTTTGPTGQPVVLFDTAALPDRVLLKACGTRRETLCPPCAAVYRGDAFALVVAGLRGGKGIPDDITSHPAVLTTFTAPSFGPVHRRRSDGTCHPTGLRCPHGTALVCGRRHADGDPLVGQPLCPDCYDYEGAVLFNAGVSELWRRTTIYALRELGRLAGLSVRQAERTLRLSYVKVVEFQRRGSVHVHAVVRVDHRGDEHGTPPAVSGELLAGALLAAARRVSAPPPEPGSAARLRWGSQADVAVIGDSDDGRRRAAAYTAKYACKGSDADGILDHRFRGGVPHHLELPAHLRALAETAWRLGDRPDLGHLRLHLWAHTCGHRGHFLTKSRRYSTTFGQLRADRQRWRVEHGHAEGDQVSESPATGQWRFEGVGYRSTGDAWLAAGIAEAERLGRQAAWEDRQWASATTPEPEPGPSPVEES